MSGWWLVVGGLFWFAWREARLYDAQVAEPRSHVDTPRPAPNFYDYERETW